MFPGGTTADIGQQIKHPLMPRVRFACLGNYNGI